MKKVAVLCLMLLSINLSVGISQTKEIDQQVSPAFVAHLDSLKNLSYVQEALKTAPKPLDSYPSFNDTVYSQRLGELSSLIDLNYNKKVKAYIEVYTFQKRRETEIMLGLTQVYFPIFKDQLKAANLPLELMYLPVVQSSLFPRAVSDDGASGIWQLMYPIARRYKLGISSYNDERRDPQAATKAACAYLKDMYSIYQDWTLAIAAYNCGPGNINKAISRSGGQTDYWTLYKLLPEHERDIIPAYIALVYLMNHYTDHQLTPIEINIQQAVDTVLVDEKLHLGQVAKYFDLPLAQLRDMNLKYRRNIIHPGKDGENLYLPVGYGEKFVAQSDSVYAYQDSIFFKPAAPVVMPDKPAYVARTHTTSQSSTSTSSSSTASYQNYSTEGKTKLYYTVKSGDSVGLIAAWYGVSLSALKSWNRIGYNNRIYVGQKLVVWVPQAQAGRYLAVNTMTYQQKQKSIGRTTTASASSSSSSSSSGTASTSSSNSKAYVYYTIKSGDNLWLIAQKYPGVSHEDIRRINGFPRNYRLYPGQVIKIKRR